MIALGLLAAGCASAPQPATLTVGPAIFRAVEVSGPDIEVAAYVRITNAAATPDQLVAAACECADRVEIHNTFDSSMHVLPAFDLPAGQATDIRPGGPTHLMLIGMKSPHANGETVRVTLSFASGASVAADFTGVGNSAEGWKAALGE